MSERQDLETEFVGEVVQALRHLGARSDLLGLVASWRDSREDEDVVAGLKRWNEEKARQDGPGGQEVE